MGLIDTAGALVRKATDFKTRIFNFEVMKAPNETTYKDRLFKGKGSGKPALQHKFILQIQDDLATAQSRLNARTQRARTDEGGKMYFLDTVMAIPEIDTSFDFNVDPKTGYSVIAAFPNTSKVTVTYWDFDDYPHTQFLTQKYYAQFNADGLLNIPYATTKIIISDQLQDVTLDYCALSKPKSSGFNATLGMRTFTFDVIFGDISSIPSSPEFFDDLMMSMNNPQ